MNNQTCHCHLSQQLHALDQAVYNLWRLYGYSEPYWKLENARLEFESYAVDKERAPIHAKQ